MTRVRVLPLLGVLVSVLALTLVAGPAAGARGSTSARDCAAKPARGHFTCFAVHRTDIRQPALSRADTPAGYGPTDITSAYSLPSAANGSGQRVYIVDAYDSPNAASDLATYRSQYGLPPCTAASGCFQKLNQRGDTSSFPARDEGWAGEISLDLDMVSATCPQCAITLIEANTDGNDLFTATAEAVSLGAKFVSMSWGGGEDLNETYYDRYFVAPGVVFTAATGDDGAVGGVSYPASSPDVVAVGGTSLHSADNARGWSETAWSGAGSGCSNEEAKPSYQYPVAASICGNRAVADVSAVADPDTGVAAYLTFPGTSDGWAVAGGTSASAPIIASVYALAGTPSTTSSAQRSLYNNPTDLNDVPSGSTGTCSPAALCTARPGWDGPTGLGTPNGLAAFTAAPDAAGSYAALTPSRLLDTRTGTGTTATGKVPAGGTLSVQVTGRGGVPVDGVAAIALHVTVTGPSANGYVTAFAGLDTRPTASNLNFVARQTVANTVIAPVGADGMVDLYASAATDLVADVSGYYRAGAPTEPGTFGPLRPARLLDTRNGTGTSGAGQVPAGRAVTIQVTGRGGVPTTGVGAVAVNITATGPGANGYVTAFAAGTARPGTSSLNYPMAATVPNLVVVPIGSGGRISLYTSARTHLVVDVAGYFRSGRPTASGSLQTLPPTRLLDTRPQDEPVPGGSDWELRISGSDNVPSSITSVVLNVTATGSTSGGYVTVHPGDSNRPGTSSVNYPARGTVANLVIVPVGPRGSIDFYVSSSTDLIVDVVGYTTF